MPEIAEPPTKETVNPKLQALFDISLPEQPEEIETPVAEPEKTTTTPEKVESVAQQKPVVEPKKDAITSRLAPDFAAEVEATAAGSVPEIEITDEMIANAKTPKAQADMKRFREAHDALKKEVETLRSRPLLAPESEETKTLLESVTKERDDLLARVERANLLDSPKFQREFLAPRDKEFATAQAIVKESGGDAEGLRRAISLTGQARIAALDEIREAIPSDMMKGRFDRLIESIDNKTLEINEKLRNSKQTADELQRDETINKHKQLEKMEGEMKALLGAARRDLVENVKLEALVKYDKPGYEWWNEQVDDIDRTAEEVLLKSTPQKAAIAAYLAASAGAFRSMWQAERAANKAKDQEIAELKGASPTLKQEHKTAAVDKGTAEVGDLLSRLRDGAYRK